MRGHPPTSPTAHPSTPAANRQPRRLRHASFGLVILLVIQYILGLANNLHGTAPTATRDISEFSSPLLAVHVINGTLLIVAAIWLVVVTVRARARLAVITSVIGLLSVLAAFYGGERFIHEGGASGWYPRSPTGHNGAPVMSPAPIGTTMPRSASTSTR
jgi:heme A synthase